MPGPYELYLIRHGLAEERGEAWPDDTKRPLTDEGMSRMRKAAPRPRAARRRPSTWCSRARSSARVRRPKSSRPAFEPRPSLVNVDSLAPGGSYAAVLADLEKHAEEARIALVGHEPGIGELAARLIGSRHAIDVQEGRVCRIDLDDLPPAGPGELRWMLTPKIASVR